MKGMHIPALRWVSDAADAPRVVLSDSCRALVENHTGILELTDSLIRLNTRRGIVTIEGEALSMTQVRPDSAQVEGRICCVRLSETERPHG